MRSNLKYKAMVATIDGVAAAAGANNLVAAAATFGPQTWENGTDTGRYRRHAGTHDLSITGCGSSVEYMELRVDIIDRPDVGYGIIAYRCNDTTRHEYSGYDTYGDKYRGHFMPARSAFYGTLSGRFGFHGGVGVVVARRSQLGWPA
jgi:hypothetical protein